jgi:hypothetical protein
MRVAQTMRAGTAATVPGSTGVLASGQTPCPNLAAITVQSILALMPAGREGGAP